MTNLLLFVGLLTLAFLLGAIRYWHDMRLHDRAWAGGPKYLTKNSLTGRLELADPEWQDIPRSHGYVAFDSCPPRLRDEAIHPDLIEVNLSDIERQIIANALNRGEDLPGVGPSFAD